MPKRLSQPSRSPRRDRIEDSAIARLSKEERAKLAMDSWEPSLLRQLLTAHNKLKEKSGG
jgi:hypothetical protein